jgi:hypothetical protein
MNKICSNNILQESVPRSVLFSFVIVVVVVATFYFDNKLIKIDCCTLHAPRRRRLSRLFEFNLNKEIDRYKYRVR